MNNHPFKKISIFIYPVCLKQIQSGVLGCLHNWLAIQLSRSSLFFNSCRNSFAHWISRRELIRLRWVNDKPLTFLEGQEIQAHEGDHWHSRDRNTHPQPCGTADEDREPGKALPGTQPSLPHRLPLTGDPVMPPSDLSFGCRIGFYLLAQNKYLKSEIGCLKEPRMVSEWN